MRERIDPGALDRRYLGCCLPEEEFVERIGRLREEQKKTQRRIEGIRHDVRAFDSEKAYNDDVDDTCCACKCCLVDEDRHCWSREEIGFRSMIDMIRKVTGRRSRFIERKIGTMKKGQNFGDGRRQPFPPG
ncbi:hypothetical protein L596_011196 [Steinernema carpocapsae]|uniref:Uncharacterized protein n=1 Tax=Steinernema carpocapsae TaxID=34508 RepID=A0A4U5NT20_STECR|nr:hypothetical protein L596_011196 [Steinernema carpocapsae]